MTSLFRFLSLIIFFSLVACSDSDSGSSMSASAPATSSESAASSAPAASTESAGSADMERAEGVVYQDEIYANWPYQ